MYSTGRTAIFVQPVKTMREPINTTRSRVQIAEPPRYAVRRKQQGKAQRVNQGEFTTEMDDLEATDEEISSMAWSVLAMLTFVMLAVVCSMFVLW